MGRGEWSAARTLSAVLNGAVRHLLPAGRWIGRRLPPGEAPPPNGRLNPIFDVPGERLVMVTQFATAMRVAELGARVGSLDHEHLRVIGAIDVLIGTA